MQLNRLDEAIEVVEKISNEMRTSYLFEKIIYKLIEQNRIDKAGEVVQKITFHWPKACTLKAMIKYKKV